MLTVWRYNKQYRDTSQTTLNNSPRNTSSPFPAKLVIKCAPNNWLIEVDNDLSSPKIIFKILDKIPFEIAHYSESWCILFDAYYFPPEIPSLFHQFDMSS
jgi:hypothetical protein